MRLIDADALRASMYHEAFETDTDMQRWDGGCWIRYKMFETNLDKAPTIEPERKTGKWRLGLCGQISDATVKWYDQFFSGGFFYCSVCKKRSSAKTRYCPNCGARLVNHETD